MKEIIWVKVCHHKQQSNELFSIATVSQAIGRSEGSINGYFSNKQISVKGGITIDQIIEVMESPIRGKAIDWDGVKRIEELLRQRGYQLQADEEEKI